MAFREEPRHQQKLSAEELGELHLVGQQAGFLEVVISEFGALELFSRK